MFIILLIIFIYFIRGIEQDENNPVNPPVNPGDVDLQDININQFGNYQRENPNVQGYSRVNVSTANNANVQANFNTNVLPINEVESVALNLNAGETSDKSINVQIPDGQGVYIPEGTVTNYKLGKYRYVANGLYMMENYPNSDNWVIPGAIEVDVPLPQLDPNTANINQNGQYNIGDLDNNPDDVEIGQVVRSREEGQDNKIISILEKEKTRDNANIIGTFTVNVQPNLQDKSETISTNTVTSIRADNGYDGLGTVTVTTNIPSGINIESNKVENITSNGQITVLPSYGYDAIGSVTINTNVTSGSTISLPIEVELAFNSTTLPTTNQLWEEFTIVPSDPDSGTLTTVENGKTYIAVILVKLNANDASPVKYIHTMSGICYVNNGELRYTKGTNDDAVITIFICSDTTTHGNISNWNNTFQLMYNGNLLSRLPYINEVAINSSNYGHINVYSGLSGVTPNSGYRYMDISGLKILNI